MRNQLNLLATTKLYNTLMQIRTMKDSTKLTHRVAVLDEELCQPRKCGLECIMYCPVNKTGGECIVLSDDSKKAVISEDFVPAVVYA